MKEETVDLGPVEVLVISFPGNQFNGEIIPELRRLIDADVIDLIDGVFINKDGSGNVAFLEFDQLTPDDSAADLAALLHQVESLISDEDVAEFAAGLDDNSSEAVLVVEHRWARKLRDSIVDSGGELADNFRVPHTAVQQLLSELNKAEPTEVGGSEA
jgi:hypothetical protein